MASLRAAACTPFGQGKDPARLVHDATEASLAAASMARSDVDALIVANAEAEAFCDVGNVSVWTANHAGLSGCWSVRIDTGPSSGLAALGVAQALVDGGNAENVLVLGWETMSGVPTPEATRILQSLMHPLEQALGLSLPGLVAIMTTAYLEQHDRGVEELAKIPVKAHRFALENPIAQFQRAITEDQVRSSRVIADPLRLLHCAPLTDGAVGVIVGSSGPVTITGMGQATDALGYTQRRTPPWRFQATRDAAASLFEASQTGRESVDVVELHDAFSVLEPVSLEDLGLVEDGEGLDHVPQPGEDLLTVRPVVNPSGGLKARGHPVGATGLAQVAECVDQLTGSASNQVPGAKTALVHSIGGFGNNVHTALLEGNK